MRNLIVAVTAACTFVLTGMAIDENAQIADHILHRASVPAVNAIPVSRLRNPIIMVEDGRPFDREGVMRILFDRITKGAITDTEKVRKVAAWVQDHFVHPMYTPLRPNGQGVHDPLQLLADRRAQCGQVNRVMIDILAAGGYRGRVVQLKAHQGAEVFFGGGWHYIEADAMIGGDQIMDADGRLPSAKEIHERPDLLDGYCLGCEWTLLPEPLSPEQARLFNAASAFYRGGGAWREVFSVPPIYYEKSGGTNDPHYGWMTYRTTDR
jgi:hypothetical protein